MTCFNAVEPGYYALESEGYFMRGADPSLQSMAVTLGRISPR